MEQPVVIRHRAGLIVRLIDTATGQEIVQAGGTFVRDGGRVHPMQRPDGMLVFSDFPAQDCTFTVQTTRFLPKTVQLSAEQLAQRPPLVELHLIPDETYAARYPCCTLSGVLDGIEQLDAVRMGDKTCLARAFDERRQIFHLFNPHHLVLDRTYYAVVDPDACRYEPIEITEQLSGEKFRLAAPLQRPFGNHFPVARRVLGAVRRSGEYVFRVPEDSTRTRWLVRWRREGEEFFQTVDFALPDTMTLVSPPTAAEAGED